MHLGHGIGLRTAHYTDVLERALVGVDWLEIVSENFFEPGGRPWAVLERARAQVPIVAHGVSLGIADTDPLDERYLALLCELVERLEPAWVSDHLCWSSFAGRRAHDLLPLPYSEEALSHVVARVGVVQERLGRRIVLENVSSYVGFGASTIPEWEFLNEVASRTGCGVLLDLNNVQVTSRNLGLDPLRYLDGLAPQTVVQIHLAGHTDRGSYLFDTHVGPVPEAIWSLYRRALRRFGPVATLVEWDSDVPALEVVAAEAARARATESEELAKWGSPHWRRAAPASLPPPSRREATPAPARGEDLRGLQERFFELVTGRKAPPAEPVGWLRAAEGTRIDERTDVYRCAYAFRLVDCLRDDFPSVAVLTGAAFDGLVRDYVARHPPTHPSLRRLGVHFSAFAREHPLAKVWPWLADLAALEWARVEAFDAQEAAALTSRDLAAIEPARWPAFALRTSPSVRVLALGHPVDRVWRALQAGEAPPAVVAARANVVVYRRAQVVYHRPVSALEASALRRMKDGATLVRVCECFADEASVERAAEEAFGLVAQWVADELLVASPPPSPGSG
jgi:uncharacterized protein (UPF0276 family)